MSSALELPVGAVLPELIEALRRHGAVVLQAPTGSGKTTCVPPALAVDGPVVVLEPRRVAARAAARFVAKRWGCKVGAEVGYQVRDDRKPGSRVTFVTEGILLRWLVEDPFLERVHTVVFDEFHERSLDGDLALALVRQAREARDLRVVVMSATLDAAPIAAFLDAPVIQSEGRTFPVQIEFAKRPSSTRIWERVADAVKPLQGSVLVFLPGRGEIERSAELISRPTLPLHGGLSAAEQDAVFRPGPKLILATNVAESSITVPDVTTVVDTGVARVPYFDASTGIDRLVLGPIAKDSADQRAGRAGRVQAGRCLRLWTAADHRDRPAHTEPAMHRRDLAPVLLTLLATGEPDPHAFRWFDAPEPHRIDAAMELLQRLGAIDGGLTRLGRKMAGLPLAPRLARFFLETGRDDWAQWLSDKRVSGRMEDLHPPRPSRRFRGGGRGSLQDGVIAAWPDRIGRRRGTGGVLANGVGVEAVSDDWFVAVGLHSARTGKRGERLVELVCRIDPARLPTGSRTETRMVGERVSSFAQELRGGLVLHEHPCPLDRSAATPVLAAAVRFSGPPPWDELLWRLQRADLAEGARERVLQVVCARCTTFDQVRKANWTKVMRDLLTWDERQQLATRAPTSLQVAGRERKLTWTPEGPVLAMRIQHLFGVPKTPSIDGEPVLLHLLAPNGRPQQITRDLASFWRTTYFDVRKELRQRYKKHPWPDDPLI